MPLPTLLLISLAHALDADTFEPGAAADQGTGVQVVDPSIGTAGSRYAGVFLFVADDPLVRELDDGSEEKLVDSATGLHLYGGYTLRGIARLEAAVAVYPWVAMPTDESSGVALGDLRLSATVPVLVRDSGLTIGVVPALILPTGSTARFTGEGQTSGAFTVAAGLRPTRRLAFNANLGVLARPGLQLGTTKVGSGLTTGIGGALRATDQLSLGLELDGLVDFAGTWRANPWEVHAFGRWGAESGVSATLGLGTGLVAGVGAPDVRVIAGVGFRQPGAPLVKDGDDDGLADADDACPANPEDLDGRADADGCPEDDADDDTCPDASDRCPDAAEDLDGFEDDDGCPDLDDDRDGVVDAQDACPRQAGAIEARGCPDGDGDGLLDGDDECPDLVGPPACKGCPDADGDLVPDAADACPAEPRDPREDPTRSDGCPKRVFVSLQRLEIKDKIFFATNTATIKAESYGLLTEIARVLRENPDLVRVEVAGHSDGVGDDVRNLALSQGRAEAVVTWLVAQGGVAPERLRAVGYGETEPIDTNATEPGRAANRRVEFLIRAIDETRISPPPPRR